MIGLLHGQTNKSFDLLDTISILREALETFIKEKSIEQKENKDNECIEHESDIDLLSLDGISDEKQILEV